MLKKVQSTSFHEGLFIVGLGNIGNVLPSPNKTYRGFRMAAGVVDGVPGLHIEANGIKFTVPFAQCKFIQYAPTETLIPADTIATIPDAVQRVEAPKAEAPKAEAPKPKAVVPKPKVEVVKAETT